MTPIRVLIADDHSVLRAGLRMLLGAQPGFDVVAEAANGDETVRQALETEPDVVTLDLSMPGGSFPLIERLRKECSNLRILVLTMHDDPAYFRAVLEAGGSAYVVKSAPETDVVAAIRAVAEGRTFVSLSITENLGQAIVGLQRLPDPGEQGPPVSALSHREREVLRLAAQGYTNQQIADQLFLSIKTIETYRARLMSKLGLKSRVDLMRYAASAGLT